MHRWPMSHKDTGAVDDGHEEHCEEAQREGHGLALQIEMRKGAVRGRRREEGGAGVWRRARATFPISWMDTRDGWAHLHGADDGSSGVLAGVGDACEEAEQADGDGRDRQPHEAQGHVEVVHLLARRHDPAVRHLHALAAVHMSGNEDTQDLKEAEGRKRKRKYVDMNE